MIAFPTLYAQLEQLVAATWPDVVSGSSHYIRETDHIMNIPFEALTNQATPYAIITFPAPQPFTDAGMANRAYRLECEFWYVAEVTLGSSALWAKAEAMAAALWAEGRTPTLITAGQVWSDPMPRPQWGVGLPVNQFLRSKMVELLACGATATVLVGEQAN